MVARVHCVAGLLKHWLGRLPEPLIPSACRPYSEFDAIGKTLAANQTASAAPGAGEMKDEAGDTSRGDIEEDIETMCELLENGERAVIEASLCALHKAHKDSSVELLRRHVRVLSAAEAR